MLYIEDVRKQLITLMDRYSAKVLWHLVAMAGQLRQCQRRVVRWRFAVIGTVTTLVGWSWSDTRWQLRRSCAIIEIWCCCRCTCPRDEWWSGGLDDSRGSCCSLYQKECWTSKPSLSRSHVDSSSGYKFEIVSCGNDYNRIRRYGLQKGIFL